jgi:CspA family cold shock protein
VFVHITAVERAGMGSLVEGQKVSFEAVHDRKSGKTAAESLQSLSGEFLNHLNQM